VSNRGKVYVNRAIGGLLVLALAARGLLLLQQGEEPRVMRWGWLVIAFAALVSERLTRRARKEYALEREAARAPMELVPSEADRR
jgi:hypothetical protein